MTIHYDTTATLELCEAILAQLEGLHSADTLALCELIVADCEARAEARTFAYHRRIFARKAA